MNNLEHNYCRVRRRKQAYMRAHASLLFGRGTGCGRLSHSRDWRRFLFPMPVTCSNHVLLVMSYSGIHLYIATAIEQGNSVRLVFIVSYYIWTHFTRLTNRGRAIVKSLKYHSLKWSVLIFQFGVHAEGEALIYSSIESIAETQGGGVNPIEIQDMEYSY